MIYRVRHLTRYSYAEPVLVAQHMAHLTPRIFPGQTRSHSALRIDPLPSSLKDGGTDYFGNPVTFFTVETPHRRLSVESLSRVKIEEQASPPPASTIPWEMAAQAVETDPSMLDAAEFRFPSPFVPMNELVADYARQSFPVGTPLLAATLDLNARIHRDFQYDPTATTLATPLSQVMADRRGVCQDFAHLGIACLRSLGLAARYVSGYLLTRPPPGQPKLKGSDASHAWLSVFMPGCGWIGLDPTNDCLTGIEHVTTAWGRDYGDVSPLSGVVLGGGEQSLKVAVDVEPLER